VFHSILAVASSVSSSVFLLYSLFFESWVTCFVYAPHIAGLTAALIVEFWNGQLPYDNPVFSCWELYDDTLSILYVQP
jgi:hypothetical protein